MCEHRNCRIFVSNVGQTPCVVWCPDCGAINESNNWRDWKPPLLVSREEQLTDSEIDWLLVNATKIFGPDSSKFADRVERLVHEVRERRAGRIR